MRLLSGAETHPEPRTGTHIPGQEHIWLVPFPPRPDDLPNPERNWKGEGPVPPRRDLPAVVCEPRPRPQLKVRQCLPDRRGEGDGAAPGAPAAAVLGTGSSRLSHEPESGQT